MNKLKEIRAALKITQAELGKGLSISRSQVASIESGSRNMTERIERDLVTHFGVNPEWLKSQSDIMFTDKYKDFNLDKEERSYIDLFESLDAENKELILTMMKKISSK